MILISDYKITQTIQEENLCYLVLTRAEKQYLERIMIIFYTFYNIRNKKMPIKFGNKYTISALIHS